MKRLTLILGILLFATAGGFSQQEGKEYKVRKSIPVTGNGSWDNLVFDNLTQRIFVTHENCVQVIDLKTGKEVGIINHTPGAHAISLSRELGKGFISAGNIDSVIVFDLTTLRIKARIPTGKNPGPLLFDQFSQRVFAFNAIGHSVTVIDADSNKVIKTIPVHGVPSAAVADNSGSIYIGLENLGMVEQLDAVSFKIKGMFPLGPDKHPSAMALDKGNDNVLIGCTGSNELVVLNITSSQVVATVPIGMHCDGVCFMPASRDVFTSNGEGSITVIHQEAPFNFSKQQTLITKRGAHTITCDYASQTLYLPTAKYDDVKKEYERNSFQLMVVSK